MVEKSARAALSAARVTLKTARVRLSAARVGIKSSGVSLFNVWRTLGQRIRVSPMKSAAFLLLLAFTCATGCIAADKKATEPKATQPRPYVLKMCLVSDEKLDKGDPTFIYKGREIRVCCEGCVKDFKKDPEKYLKLIEAEEKKQAADKSKQPGK